MNIDRAERVRSGLGPRVAMHQRLSAQSPPSRMLHQVIVQLVRTTFLGISLCGIGYGHPGYAWLFGVLFIHSLLDGSFYAKPTLMEAYLLFTVVFYFHRYVMGWGASTTTIYKDDAPDWVKVLKDVVWTGFVLAMGLKALLGPRLDRHTRLLFALRGRVLICLVILYCSLPLLSLFYRRGGLFDSVLYAVRYPLEYVPFVFLLPFVLRGRSSVRYLRFFVPLVIITLLFLAYEVFSGRRTGFGYGGIYNRYGSIFGSPNDFGMFLTLAMTILLAFLIEKAIRWSPKAVGLLGLCLCALAATVSLSAIFAALFSGLVLTLFARRKLTAVSTVASLVVLVVGLYYAFPRAGVSNYLTERIENLGTLREGSAYGHYTSVIDVEKQVARFTPEEWLTGTLGSPSNVMLPETYYLRTLYIRGLPSLVILLIIVVLSAWEAQHRYRESATDLTQRGLFLGLLICVCSFTFGSAFIPYFDTFPSNFYFWFLVAIIWSEPVRQVRKVSGGQTPSPTTPRLRTLAPVGPQG